MKKNLFRFIFISFVISCLLNGLNELKASEIKPLPKPDEVKAIYLSTNHIFNKKKIQKLENILLTTTANGNGIVID